MKRLIIAAAIGAAAFLSLGAAQAIEPASAPQASLEWTQGDEVISVNDAATYNAADAEIATLTQYQPDGQAEVPWGDWLSEALKVFTLIAGSIALWALRKLPPHIGNALDMFAGMMGQGRANELLEKAVTYGINTTAGAVKGRTLTIKVGNEVLERAFEYALRHAPSLVGKLGGLAQVREKIIARLDLDETSALPAARAASDQPRIGDGAAASAGS